MRVMLMFYITGSHTGRHLLPLGDRAAQGEGQKKLPGPFWRPLSPPGGGRSGRAGGRKNGGGNRGAIDQ